GGSCAKTSPGAGTLSTAVLGARGRAPVRGHGRSSFSLASGRGRPEREKRPRPLRSSSLRRPLVGSACRSARLVAQPEKVNRPRRKTKELKSARSREDERSPWVVPADPTRSRERADFNSLVLSLTISPF